MSTISETDNLFPPPDFTTTKNTQTLDFEVIDNSICTTTQKSSSDLSMEHVNRLKHKQKEINTNQAYRKHADEVFSFAHSPTQVATIFGFTIYMF